MISSVTVKSKSVSDMNKQALSDWVKGKLEEGYTLRGLASDLGFADTSVAAWLDQKIKRTLKPRAVEAIARHDDAPIADTYKWLGIPMPSDASVGSEVEQLRLSVTRLEQQLAALSDVVYSRGFRPSKFALWVQDQLHQGGYDLCRDDLAYKAFLREAEAAMEGNKIRTRRAIGQIMGAIAMEKQIDFTNLALIMRRTLGNPNLTTGYLQDQEAVLNSNSRDATTI